MSSESGAWARTEPTAKASAPLCIEYLPNSYLPAWTAKTSTPYAVLTYAYDSYEEKLLAEHEEELQRKVLEISYAADDHAAEGKKKMSLRLRTKKASSNPPPAPDLSDAIKLFNDHLALMHDEIVRITATMNRTADILLRWICKLGKVHQRERTHIDVMVSFAVLDTRAAQHPLLKGLGMHDNEFLRHIGQSVLDTYIYAYTLGNFDIDTAKRRLDKILKGADVWLTEIAGKEALQMMPVVWELDHITYKRMNEVDLKSEERRVMCSVPFLMIGILNQLHLYTEQQNIINNLIGYFA